jgi:NAD-dependent SIR2 family protein deacetylase
LPFQIKCNLYRYTEDRLHHAAGSRDVLELHGTTHEVGGCTC